MDHMSHCWLSYLSSAPRLESFVNIVYTSEGWCEDDFLYVQVKNKALNMSVRLNVIPGGINPNGDS